MSDVFNAVLNAYNELDRRPLEIQKYRAKAYKPLWVDGWPLKSKKIKPRKNGEAMVHYEFLTIPSKKVITIELHLESPEVSNLKGLIDHHSIDLEAHDFRWTSSPWLGRKEFGRLMASYYTYANPNVIAEDMVKFIDATEDQITTWIKQQGLWGLSSV